MKVNCPPTGGSVSPSDVTCFNIADDTFIVADSAEIGRAVAQPARWAGWWPELVLVVSRSRGRQGLSWTVAGTWAGQAWTGSMEIWIETALDGVVLHHYVRLDPFDGVLTPGELSSLTARYSLEWKRHVFALKDELEMGRPVGVGRQPERRA